MVKRDQLIVVGRSLENEWRRSNLLKVPGVQEFDNCYEVSFQFVEHTKEGVAEILLTYQILK